MLKIGTISLLLLIGAAAEAQPPINQWYSFGLTQSIFGSVIATDSCYYATGLGASTVSGIWDAGFYKIGFDGAILSESYMHNDTVSINHFSAIGNSFISTNDGNFAALAVQFPYYRFIKYAPSGDTIFTKLITEFYVNEGHAAYQAGDLVQLAEDSSFTCTGWVAYNSEMQSGVHLFNISDSGDVNFSNTFFCENTVYTQHIPAGLIKTADGYVVSTSLTKVGSPIDQKRHVRFITTDNFGNEIATKTFWDEASEVFPRGFSQTEDGGYIHGGLVGDYSAPLNTNKFLGQVVKMDENFERVWQTTLGDSLDMNYIHVNNIVTVDNGYVATGFSYVDSMICGWMYNLDLDGQVIWDSYFSFVPDTSFNFPEHRFYDLKKTPDNGFVIVGQAWNTQTTLEGNPGNFAWLVKTDSVGCLVPGCQDFLETTATETPVIKLNIYPNPTNNILNIYYFDPKFDGKSEVLIYDLKGNLLKRWRLHSNDMTYIYDVSGLVAGIYVLEIFTDGTRQLSEKVIVSH